MALQITENFNEKLAEMYSSKVTVNLDNVAVVEPTKILNSLELIAINHRAMINFRINK